mgnify:CR=1 FL=1
MWETLPYCFLVRFVTGCHSIDWSIQLFFRRLNKRLIYHRPQEMHSMHRKCNFLPSKPTSLKIEPTFRVALELCTFSIRSGPDTIMIIPIFNNFLEISWIKLTIEENGILIIAGELNIGMLGYIRQFNSFKLLDFYHRFAYFAKVIKLLEIF